MFQANSHGGAVAKTALPVATLRALLCSGAAALALLAGCASPQLEAPQPPPLALEKFQTLLADGITLDYQVERKISQVNKRSCFVYITGKVNNSSGATLSRQSVLDIAVFSQGKQLYRDNTSPLADVRSGFNAPFEMVVSPVFADGCPRFDRINIALRKAAS